MTDIKQIWRSQPIEGHPVITLADLHQRARTFHTRIRWRNIALVAFSAFILLTNLWALYRGYLPRFRAPIVLMSLAQMLVFWQVWRRGAPRSAAVEAPAQAALDFHRQELERQRKNASTAWLWYIAPFLPAFMWELASWLQNMRPEANPAVVPLFVMVVFSAITFWGWVWLLFSRHAARLQIQIAELKGLAAE